MPVRIALTLTNIPAHGESLPLPGEPDDYHFALPVSHFALAAWRAALAERQSEPVAGYPAAPP
jgi:hypothetical protein